jgi:hypothetical protein
VHDDVRATGGHQVDEFLPDLAACGGQPGGQEVRIGERLPGHRALPLAQQVVAGQQEGRRHQNGGHQ